MRAEQEPIAGLAEAIAILRRGGGDFADIFVEDSLQVRLKREDRQPVEMVQGSDAGAGLRLVRGDFTAFACTTDLSPEGLQTAARDLVQAADQGGDGMDWQTRSAHPARITRPIDSLVLQERMRLAERAEAAAWGAGDGIRQVTVLLAGTRQRVTIADTDGRLSEDERSHVVLWVQAVAARDALLQTGYESAGGAAGWEWFERVDPASVGELAGARAVRLLDARPAPSGPMTVVLAAEAGGTMIHEAIGHSLEADLVQKQLSPFGGREGQAVAAPLITVVDDATLPGWRGSFGCDDEGAPAQRTVLVEAGVLRGFLHDRRTARKAGVPPTGNGRRQSYAHRPIPRMTNTMILPGQDRPEDILHSVDRGLYVLRMGGGQVNTVNGDFVFEVSEGVLIEHGRLGAPVRGATLIGNGPEVLTSIDRVGSDHGIGIGTCGKDGQGVPVADAQPTLRIPSITVGGPGEG